LSCPGTVSSGELLAEGTEVEAGVGEKEGRAPVSVTFCPRTNGMARSGKSLDLIMIIVNWKMKVQSRALDWGLGISYLTG
jgi:hypothetical protein